MWTWKKPEPIVTWLILSGTINYLQIFLVCGHESCRKRGKIFLGYNMHVLSAVHWHFWDSLPPRIIEDFIKIRAEIPLGYYYIMYFFYGWKNKDFIFRIFLSKVRKMNIISFRYNVLIFSSNLCKWKYKLKSEVYFFVAHQKWIYFKIDVQLQIQNYPVNWFWYTWVHYLLSKQLPSYIHSIKFLSSKFFAFHQT